MSQLTNLKKERIYMNKKVLIVLFLNSSHMTTNHRLPVESQCRVVCKIVYSIWGSSSSIEVQDCWKM